MVKHTQVAALLFAVLAVAQPFVAIADSEGNSRTSDLLLTCIIEMTRSVNGVASGHGIVRVLL